MERHHRGLRRARALLAAMSIAVATALAGAWTGAPAAAEGGESGSAVTIRRDAESVTVSKTANLTRERITVSWTGMRASGTAYDNFGRVADGVAVFQCRGTDPELVDRRDCWARDIQIERNLAFDSQETAPWAKYQLDAAGNPQPQIKNIPFRLRDGTLANVGEAGFAGAGALPDENPGTQNLVYGRTGPSGAGSVEFTVNTAAENPSLGCSTSLPEGCSLVVVPLRSRWDCPRNEDGAPLFTSAQMTRSIYQACTNPNNLMNKGGDGSKAWALASNWSGRYVVPLKFLPEAERCPEVRNPANFVGSELVAQAMRQWLPARCDRAEGALDYTVTAEPDARRLFAAASPIDSSGFESDAALTVAPLTAAADPRKPAYAPVAVSGFVVGFNLNISTGERETEQITQLRLNARLLAKLLTQSYGYCGGSPAGGTQGVVNPDAAGNPCDLVRDPEFGKLNPHLPRYETHPSYWARIIETGQLGISVQRSDVWRQVTAYLSADPDARAFLQGKADPWGMRVNRHYLGWLGERDEYDLKDDFSFSAEELPATNQLWADVPFFGQLANLGGTWRETAESAMVGWPLNRGTVTGDGNDSDPYRFTRAPRANPGGGREIVLTTAADAARNHLPVASLDHPLTGEPVLPDTRGFTRALNDVAPDPKTGMWRVDPATVAPGGYPGTMVTYAALPTTGLSTTSATAYAEQVRWMSREGQLYGAEPGRLPEGYLALTDPMVAQATKVADAVAAQSGTVPKPTGDPLPPEDDPTPEDGPAPGDGPDGGEVPLDDGGTVLGAEDDTAAGPDDAPVQSAAEAAPKSTTPTSTAAVAAPLTRAERLSGLAIAVIGLLAFSMLAGVAGPLARVAWAHGVPGRSWRWLVATTRRGAAAGRRRR